MNPSTIHSNARSDQVDALAASLADDPLRFIAICWPDMRLYDKQRDALLSLCDNGEALTIHHGRHTFISHALAGDRTLAEVRDAAGHANVSITSAYLHVAVDDDEVGDLFGSVKVRQSAQRFGSR